MKKRVMLLCCIIAFVAATVVFGVGVGTTYASSEKQIKENIRNDAQVYSDLLRDGYTLLYNVEYFGDIRITVADMGGTVLFDSAKSDSDKMDNHSQREEIAAALAGNPTIVRRYSDTFGCYMYYYALVTEGEPSYILRVSARASNIWSYIGVGVGFVALAMAIVITGAYFVARRFSDSVESQLRSFRDCLRNINSGIYVPFEPAAAKSLDVGILSEMNELVANVQGQYRAQSEESARLNSIIGNMSQGIVAVDSKGNIELINSVAQNIFCKAGKGDSLICLLDDEKFYNKVSQLLAEGKDKVFAYERDGRNLVINVFTADIGNNQKMGVIMLGDVTKEKEAIRQKSQFFANASHELKTPLTSVQGLSEVLLSRTDEKSPDYKYISRIFTESKRLNRIVMDMLYISKLENRTVEQRCDTVDLAALCREAEQTYREEMNSKEIAFSLQGEAYVRADDHNIYECIGNIIGNAVHYNRQNGRITVTLERTDNGARIKVADTGIGIAPEHIPHLCERFYRVDKSRSKKTGGTGLGLSIVKHIVALYGGSLNIESTEGEGTVVTVYLPDADGSYAEIQ